MNAKKSLKYCIAALVCLCLATMFSAAAFAADNWIDFAATDFAGGTGTEADPYQIATAEQLAYLAVKANETNGETNNNNAWTVGKYFKLTADIDLAGKNWTPIGTAAAPDNRTFVRDNWFYGFFDGDGHVVKNMNIDVAFVDDSDYSKLHHYLGLFGQVGAGGTIDSVGVEDFNISFDCLLDDEWIQVGGLAACVYSGSAVTASYASGDITVLGSAESCRIRVGGLIGDANSMTFADLYATCNVFVSADIDADVSAGVLFGTFGSSTFHNSSLGTSYAWGSVSASVAADVTPNIGGLIGERTKSFENQAGVASCDWLADPNPGLDIGVGGVMAANLDQSACAASHDVAGFGSDNIDYFTGRGWDFETVWCYTLSDEGLRPRLRAFVDESDIMGGGGDSGGALVSTDKALDSLNNNATLKGLVSIATPSSADVNAALAEIATASGIASPKAIETVSGDLFKAKAAPDVENEDGVRSLVPSFTFMAPVGASGNVMPFAYTIIADAISTNLADDWANISSADKMAYLEEDANEISTVFAYEYVTAGGTGDGEPVTLIGKGGKWTWAEMVGEGVVVFDGTTGDITVNYIAVPATGEPYIAGKFLVIPDKQPNPGYITDPVWLMRGKASTPPPGGNSGSGVGCDAGFAFFGLLPLLPLIARRRR